LTWLIVGMPARGATPQAGTTASVYNSSTGQPVTRISQVGIFLVARQADFTVTPACDSSPGPTWRCHFIGGELSHPQERSANAIQLAL